MFQSTVTVQRQQSHEYRAELKSLPRAHVLLLHPEWMWIFIGYLYKTKEKKKDLYVISCFCNFSHCHLPSRTNADRIDLMHVLEAKKQLDGKNGLSAFISSDSGECSICKGGTLSFNSFKFSRLLLFSPKVLSFVGFACFSFAGCYFFLPFKAPEATFIYILTCDCGPDVDFLDWGWTALRNVLIHSAGLFFFVQCLQSWSRWGRRHLPWNETIRDTMQYTAAPTGHMSGGKHLQRHFCKRHICFSASWLQ